MSCIFTLPQWLASLHPDQPLADDEAKMNLAIELAQATIQHRAGGPFGALVCERQSGRVIAIGANLVLSTGQPVAHAEIVALSSAHAALGVRDLRTAVSPGGFELITSCEPCAMCYGATPWSGVTRLVCGARSEDAQAVGFDEGDKPADWVTALQRRGIDVTRDVLRDRAAAVLHRYQLGGGEIY